MKKLNRFLILISLITSSSLLSQIKANLTIKNYIKTDMSVYIESYDKNGNLKVNESFIVDKSSITKEAIAGTTNMTETIIPTTRNFTTKGYKGGNIKIKYNPAESNTKFTLDPIQIPNSNNDLNQSIALTGLVLYDVNDNKQRLISIGTDLKFDASTEFTRLIDVKQQLGSLVIGKVENNTLVIKDVIPLKDIDILYDTPSRIEQSSVTEKSVISQLKVAIPIYGSVEAKMSNSGLHQIKCEIYHYPFLSNTSFSQLITDLDAINKQALVNKLKLNDSSYSVFILRSFDVIESAIFSVTNGVKVNTEGNAAIASVFTANGAYAFRSEDSNFVSIPNKAYNLNYENWQKVGDLISSIERRIPTVLVDGNTSTNRLFPMSGM